MKTLIVTAVAAFALASAAGAQTLSVTDTVTPSSGLYNYDYVFSFTGPANAGTSVANLYLTTDDLSPIGPFSFAKDGAATANWSYASSDTPYNYLQFFSASDSLTNGDNLEVKFASAFAPSTANTVTGLDDSTGNYTNTVNGVSSPVPETSTAPLLVLGGLGIGFAAYRRRRT